MNSLVLIIRTVLYFVFIVIAISIIWAVQLDYISTGYKNILLGSFIILELFYHVLFLRNFKYIICLVLLLLYSLSLFGFILKWPIREELYFWGLFYEPIFGIILINRAKDIFEVKKNVVVYTGSLILINFFLQFLIIKGITISLIISHLLLILLIISKYLTNNKFKNNKFSDYEILMFYLFLLVYGVINLLLSIL